jgi:hypothetical protein
MMIITLIVPVYSGKKKYHTDRTFPKSNIKIVERGKIDTPDTQVHAHFLSWLGTGTSIKSGWG